MTRSDTIKTVVAMAVLLCAFVVLQFAIINGDPVFELEGRMQSTVREEVRQWQYENDACGTPNCDWLLDDFDF